MKRISLFFQKSAAGERQLGDANSFFKPILGDTWQHIMTNPTHMILYTCCFLNFDVLLTVHLSVFILIINQLDAQNLFYNKFISCLYMFRASCAHRQEVKIVLYSLWYQHTTEA